MSLSSQGNTTAGGALPVLNVAMVGHAFMGRAHGNAWRQANRFFDLPFRVVPKVLVGRHAERAAAAAHKLGFEHATTDLDAVLADPAIQVVDVATPNDSHHDITMAALRAKKHVLCEKPLAMTLVQAKAMAALAKKQKVRVGLWHNYRRAPAVQLAARMIARGDLGAIRQVRAVYLQDWLADASVPASWRTSRKLCGSGAHGDLNAHLIDLTRALTGLEFESVCGVQQTFTKERPDGAGGKAKVDVDDAFLFLAKFKGGAIGSYEATRAAPGRKNHNCIEISGEKGSIRWNLERMNELEVFLLDEPRDAQGFRTVMCMDSVHPYAANWWPDGHIVGYEHTFVHHVVDFVTALHAGSAFAPNFDDGVAVQAVLEAASTAARSGSWVKVPR
ncbi:MAG: Gfo/Idh/MocA family oxidoreductase [Planctomycetes bacterium]|jgi:predicted dehydrogenase|nr:Gfo/Idh/MocA family oxidoreductase [Planctomycetota bacterium]